MNRLTFLFFETLFSIKNYLDYRISIFFDSIYDSYFFSDDIMENKGTKNNNERVPYNFNTM